ncbi:MAG: multicopper oxidase domain-containing protein [Ilumatobacter sp.]|nr:multicopper oxidase domain-containing protein [Ilumatobacter sp.]
MTSDDRSFLNWTAIFVALAALFLGFFALGRAGSTESAAGAEGGSGGASSIIEMELGALKLTPQHIMAPPGEVTIRITNTDSQVHNLTVLGSKTRDLQPGETQDLELGELGVGVYPMLCEIPGHNEAGMNGNLHIIMNAEPGAYTGAGSSDSSIDHFHGFDTWQEMQEAMDSRAMRFVEEEKGEFGGQMLEYTMSDDGYKEFEVTAMLADWEVEPGKIVEAYTYNGTVPAPEIHVEVGDMVRVILKNELPTPTVIHWHGIRVPNAMDGVPPFTQDAVVPGEEFVYEFEALEPAVGIYHSHNGASQVLDGLFGAFTIGQMQTPDVLIDQGFAAEPDQELQMVLNDAGVIGLSLNGKSFPATEIYSGTVGDTVMVHYQNEGLQAHPMHLHQPLGWIIAKDGKELLVPIPGDTINIAPGERYTVLYKLTDPGVWAWHCHILTHAERDDGMFGMVTAFVVEEA